MKKIFYLFSMAVIVIALTPLVFATDEYTENVPQDSHKVMNKWDLEGSFPAHPGYSWRNMAPGAIWNYDIHIKQAINQQNSVGSIHFWTGDIDVVGQVKETRWDYNWARLAAFGTANYNDHQYYFMFFYDDVAVWFALSDTPYENYTSLTTELAYPSAQRAYQLHSLNNGTLEFDIETYKDIHEEL